MWDALQLWSGVAMLPIIVFAYFMQTESWKYSMTKNDEEEAVRIATHIYRKNHSDKSETEQQKDIALIKSNIHQLLQNNLAFEKTQNALKEKVEATSTWQDLKKMFKYKVMAKITLSISFIWSVNVFVYFGLSLNVDVLEGDMRLNNAIMGMCEVPGMILMLWLSEKPSIGRRKYNFIFLMLSGLFCIFSTMLTQNDYIFYGQIFAFLGKIFITGTYSLVIIWCHELYSTDVRSLGYSVCVLLSRFIGIITPYILGLKSISNWIPGTALGVVGILGGLLCLSIPETLNQPLLLRIEEAKLKYEKKKSN